MKNTDYHSDWQNNRIKFLIDTYGHSFFENKKILELGSHNGYIGNYFIEKCGANVLSVEGRKENVKKINDDYPNLPVIVSNLDVNEWIFGKWDIIINFGLFYHLEKCHTQHLVNCINNCNIMFFESVIFDSKYNEIFFTNENGSDQSLTNIGGNPSTSFVENIFQIHNCKYEKNCSASFNGDLHCYDWVDSNSRKLDRYNRRFWTVYCNDKLNNV
jgi:hypothetical protein